MSLLVFLFFERVLALAGLEGQARRAAALGAAALFAVHRLNSQTVNFLTLRSEILAAAGVTGSFVLYQRAPRLRRSFLWLLPAVMGLLRQAVGARLRPALRGLPAGVSRGARRNDLEAPDPMALARADRSGLPGRSRVLRASGAPRRRGARVRIDSAPDLLPDAGLRVAPLHAPVPGARGVVGGCRLEPDPRLVRHASARRSTGRRRVPGGLRVVRAPPPGRPGGPVRRDLVLRRARADVVVLPAVRDGQRAPAVSPVGGTASRRGGGRRGRLDAASLSAPSPGARGRRRPPPRRPCRGNLRPQPRLARRGEPLAERDAGEPRQRAGVDELRADLHGARRLSQCPILLRSGLGAGTQLRPAGDQPRHPGRRDRKSRSRPSGTCAARSSSTPRPRPRTSTTAGGCTRAAATARPPRSFARPSRSTRPTWMRGTFS